MKQERHSAIEIARFLGAIGIVWFHAKGPFGTVGLSGLSMFVVLLSFFAFEQKRRTKKLFFLSHSSLYVLRLWVVWSIFFAALKLFEIAVTNRTFQDEFQLSMVFTGPSLHLWFLPFAYIASTVSTMLAGVLASMNKQLEVLVALSSLLLAILILVVSQQVSIIVPIKQWISVMPAFFFGISIAVCSSSRTLMLSTGFGGLMLILIIPYILIGQIDVALSIGCCISLIVLTYRGQPNAFATTLGKLSLTVYLIHPIAVSVFSRTELKLMAPEVYAITVCAASAGLATMLYFSPFRRLISKQ